MRQEGRRHPPQPGAQLVQPEPLVGLPALQLALQLALLEGLPEPPGELPALVVVLPEHPWEEHRPLE